MNTGNVKTFPLKLEDVGVDKDVKFIFIEGIGYVASRNVCTGKSYNYLEKCGYATGKEITIGEDKFRCRLLTCTEWDDCMDYDDSNETWNWKDVYSWVRSLEFERAKDDYRVLRGSVASSPLSITAASDAGVSNGYRPVLEVLTPAPLNSDKKAITVEQTTSAPGNSGEIFISIGITIPKI